MGEYYGHDYHSAEETLAKRAEAARQLIRLLCGEKGKQLADSVCDGLWRAEWNFKQAAEKLVNASQFKVDFGYYLLHKCKSLKEARLYWEKATQAYSDDRKLKADVDFGQWSKKIQESLTNDFC